MYYVCFFFKQKTAYEMRISDWSSDVCSSDLLIRLDSDRAVANARRHGQFMPSAENHRNPTAQIGLLIQAMMSGHERTAVEPPTRQRRLTDRSQPTSGITVAGTIRRKGRDRQAQQVQRLARVHERRDDLQARLAREER